MPLTAGRRAEPEAGLGRPLGDVRLHTDAPAADLATQLNAQAFTTGSDVFFNRGVYDPGSPSGYNVLVHELTHTLQQAAGPVAGRPATAGLTVSDVHDTDEREARAVAERVTAGRAETRSAIVDGSGATAAHGPTTGGPATQSLATQSLALQLLGTPLNAPVPASAPQPIGETPGQQRQYTPAQYIAMWEAEQGRPLTAAEKDTIDRGCIGLTANNLNGGGDPPLDLAFGTFDQAHKVMKEKNATLDWLSRFPIIGGLLAGDARYVVFAKLFWSNQNPDIARRARSDPTAFKPDPTTGQVDMTGYEYREQPGKVNFDYGFWDEASQSFWHANHMDYGDPADPMIVLQSTKEKFAKVLTVAGETRYGYRDFDRVIYCVALAENYNPGLAAMSRARP
ncbi:MAG TPA: DUF4157 domain-containing protein [Pilimelia sp.]|nr:DUF4157 domain-containing protein [Pilimelia sp.]